MLSWQGEVLARKIEDMVRQVNRQINYKIVAKQK
jgi:hypothetical protein